jgi:hypothetical protein
MAKIIHIGDISVEPGEKKCGRIQVALRPDGSQLYIPLMVVNGSVDGPVLNVGAGCHGTEYDGSVAIRKCWHDIDPKSFSGVFLGVPVINVMAYEAGTNKSWIDQTNLNRVCPGKPDGSITERLAYVYLNEVVARADLMMDFHGGSDTDIIGNQIIWRDTLGGEEVARKSFELTRATGWKYVWKGSGGWGGTITMEALKMGVPAITLEAGGGNRCMVSVVDDYKKLLVNVMKAYNMIDGQAEYPDELVMYQGTFIPANVGGFFTQTVAMYDRVKKGKELGNIVDIYGEIIETITAPFDGFIGAERTFPLVHAGGDTVLFAKIIDNSSLK